MLRHSVGDPRRLRPWIQRSVIVLAITASVITSSPAIAGLIFTSVRFDGAVRSGDGSGPVAGVEEHFTDVDFPPPETNVSLPATNPPLAPPLDPSNDLRMRVDHLNNASLNGEIFPLDTLWITSPTTGEVFANELDNNLATPVEFETFVYLEELGPNEKLIFPGVRIESGDVPPFPSAVETIVSDNRGSEADPIHVLLRLAKDQVSFGLLKVHFYYDTMEIPPIPEPMTAVLLVGGAFGVVAVYRRRSR